MTNYVSLCLKSLRTLPITVVLIFVASTAFSAEPGCGYYLGKTKVSAHHASDAIDRITELYNSNKMLTYDFTTSKSKEKNLLDKLEPHIDLLLNFSQKATSSELLRFHRQQSIAYKNYMRSKLYDGRSDREELFKLTGTLLLIQKSGNSQHAKKAQRLAASLTDFFSNLDYRFDAPIALKEAELRNEQLFEKLADIKINRLKYNYALLLLADYGDIEVINILKTHSGELFMDEANILKQIEDLGGIIIDPQDQISLVEKGQHPGQLQRYLPKQRNIKAPQSLWKKVIDIIK